MKVLNVVRTVISYIFTLFVGVFTLQIVGGDTDFFTILGGTACVVVAVVTSPLAEVFKKEIKAK